MLDDVSFVWLLVCGSEKMKTDLEADFSDGGSVNDGEHLDEVLEKETVKESFVSLLKRRQVDVFCNRRLERSFPLLQTAGDAKERVREREGVRGGERVGRTGIGRGRGRAGLRWSRLWEGEGRGGEVFVFPRRKRPFPCWPPPPAGDMRSVDGLLQTTWLCARRGREVREGGARGRCVESVWEVCALCARNGEKKGDGKKKHTTTITKLSPPSFTIHIPPTSLLHPPPPNVLA